MIAGIFNRSSPNNDALILKKYFDSNELFAHFPYDRKQSQQSGRTILVQQDRFNSPQSVHENGPIHDPAAGLLIAAWATLYNRQELYDATTPAQSLDSLSDTALILECYRKWQHNCVDHLVGDYAFVVYDTRAESLFCARDPMGIRPFYYQLDRKGFSFASSAGCFKYIPGTELTPSREWIANFMIERSMSWQKTPFANIHKLPPAHALVIEKEQHRKYAYFRFSGEQTLFFASSEDAVAAYKEQLDRAILTRFASDYPLGFELSGGLDSSTITSYAGHYLAKEQRRKIQAFGHSMMELDPAYIHAVICRYNIRATHILQLDNYDRQAALRSIQILGFPVEHTSTFSSEPFYRLARQQGIRTLFSGFGGDEFVTNAANMLARELFQQKRWLALYNTLPGNRLTRGLRLLKRAWRFHQSADSRQHTFLYNGYTQSWPHQYVHEKYIRKYGLKTNYFGETFNSAGYAGLNEFLLNEHWHPLVPTRTESGSLMAAARGLEYRWPLLDHHLVQHFLATDSTEKHHHGMGRYLHRRAVQGIVPDRITWHPSKNMGSLTSCAFTYEQDQLFAVDSLHPLLEDLVDVEKLTGQHRALLQSRETYPLRLWIFRRSLYRLRWLDIWLKEYLQV